MAEQSKAMQESAPSRTAEFSAPRLEQILYACGGYVLAQLFVLMFFSSPRDGDYLLLGIAGAVIGILAHVLVRGVGVRVPGIGKRFRMRAIKRAERSSEDSRSSGPSDRASRYRAALAAFRTPFKRRNRKSETPGNEERIVETEEGFRVGDRVFSRRAEAEDYLYVGEAPDGNDSTASAPQQSRRISLRGSRALNAVALAAAFLLAGILLFFT